MKAENENEGSPLFDASFRIRSDYAGQLLSCAHCGTPFFRKRKDIKPGIAPTCSKACSSTLVRAVWAEHGISPRTFWQPGSAENQADACRGPKSHFYKDGIMSRRRAGH